MAELTHKELKENLNCNPKSKIGEVKKSNNCGLMKIIKYKNNRNIKVKFKTGSIVKTEYGNFKNGTVKDPLFPSVFGIGCIGVGKYKSKINNKMTIEYITWQNMLQRCYDPYYINKQPTYQDVFVCEFFQNFQNFAEWFYKWHYEIIDEKVEIDKDIIKKGNKIYCPEFCSFVPKSINSLLIKRDKDRGKYPIGVSFHKDINKYQSRLNVNGKRKYLGLFSTPKKAFDAYKIAKTKYIKIMANKYKDVLDTRVYDSLMKYNVKITD